jgi:hypothetical protein
VRPEDLPSIVSRFKRYVQSKDELEQSLVDAVILTNFNSGDMRLISFDFSLNSQ